MAKAKNSDKASGGEASALGFILALVMLTLLGGGAGTFFGMQLGGATAFTSFGDGGSVEAVDSSSTEAKDGHGGKVGSSDSDDGSQDQKGPKLVALEPIFANLAEPKNVWMRLEAALLIKPGPQKRDVLILQVSQDVMQFLRTVKLAQLEDASGLQFLRDDLNDIVRTRSDGQVSEILVKGLIVE
ncbi:putative Flagellar basal body-associated protein FliL [Candidatus Filomicrobium marinum]|uniref:Flagellar protein FliL n=2 Tax=Filomicrobium TaxID=119044 RepID=A0A0D6JJP8_9HYPH|nr:MULTISPECIES: flagellar basal body-associated FliL family protein [Filomicrobium]MCV0371617.1 flagellar basal body-associated FliL family protein [Filomicrobium sp.]CFX55525.1 putative Flagellar basal body-associated protein FliL [Candidatus Filomicrobium marinum]CPR22193.1 putative Flagellar basal body-associated protein FliL [Candidatus Filomicrobium marinum]SDO93317.1 flagellar FliL protein [Filomicrobium insigne]